MQTLFLKFLGQEKWSGRVDLNHNRGESPNEEEDG